MTTLPSTKVVKLPFCIQNVESTKADFESFDDNPCRVLPSTITSNSYSPLNLIPCSTLGSHKQQVFSLAMDGPFLYTASQAKDIRVWKLPECRECCCCFGAGNGMVNALLVKGDTVYSAHQDHKIRIWRRSIKHSHIHHKLVASLPSLTECMQDLLTNNYVGVRRHHRRFWTEHGDTISALAMARDGLLYSGSWDKTVKVWRPWDSKCVASFDAHDDAINALVAGKNGFIYTASADSKVKIWVKWSRDRHALLATLEGHKSAVNALALSPEESILYSGGSDCLVIVWKREGKCSSNGIMVKQVGCLRGHRLAVLTVCAVRDDMVCSGSADKTIRIWKRRAHDANNNCNIYSYYSCIGVLYGHEGPVKTIASTMTTQMSCLLCSGSLDSNVKVWLCERKIH